MGELSHFVPKSHLRTSENMAFFVENCRSRLTVFGGGLNFDADVWEITEASDRRASSKPERITFCTLETTGRGTESRPMAEPFKSFAKAYIRYQQGLRPTKNPAQRLGALRTLEKALRDSQSGATPDPTAITPDVLNQAAELARRHFEAATAYRIGVNLELVAQFLDENNLTPAATAWRNPIKRPEDGTRTGKEFEKRRVEKMPSAAALEALALAFNIAEEPRDVIQASVGALLLSAPARIAELLTLPHDCEAGTPPGGDTKLYGLRWWPAKGADPQVKWIIPSMIDIAKRAIDKVRQATTQARAVAAWYESNPRNLYLLPELEILRGRDLDMKEVAALLGRADGDNFCSNHRLAKRNGRVRFAEFEAHILAMLPPDFPAFDKESGTYYSKALFVVLKHQFRETPPMPCMIERVAHGQISDGFGGRVKYGVTSLFDRLELKEPDGSSITVASHQFRHLLNTMAQKGGAAQFDIAKWSGRKDFSQNTAYDHESAGELLARIRALVGDESGLFGLPLDICVNDPKTREEYGQLVAPTAHTTEIGFCLHDFSGSPCELHLDCLRCTEHVCVKGNHHKTDVLRRQLVEARSLLAKAKLGMTMEAWGSDRWVTAHTKTVALLEALLAILEDTDVPDGSIIRVGGTTGPSRLMTAAAERGIDLSPPASKGAPELEMARNLLQDMGEVLG